MRRSLWDTRYTLYLLSQVSPARGSDMKRPPSLAHHRLGLSPYTYSLAGTSLLDTYSLAGTSLLDNYCVAGTSLEDYRDEY